MNHKNLSRKLAVIVHADVVGSTALVLLDETLAHKRITETFRRLASIIQNYDGTVHEVRGDALVAAFSRASDAACATLQFQILHAEHLLTLSDEIRPIVRIGVSLGEVIFADNTVTGPGVVLAQRVEQLAKPGGVCLHGAVYDVVPRRLPFDYESLNTLPCRLPFEYENLGEHELKGFHEPIRVYAIRHKNDEPFPAPERSIKSSRWRRTAIALRAVVAALVFGWYALWQAPVEPAPDKQMTLLLSDNPSIVVLPFLNLSDDLEQEYFVDGITEDIITDLTQISNLQVLPRNTSFRFRGQSLDLQKVALDLKVSHILEGSVRISGEKLRISARLIDSSSGKSIWAKRYDRQFRDVFKVQDDVASNIASSLSVQLTEQIEAVIEHHIASNFEANDLDIHLYRLSRCRELDDQEQAGCVQQSLSPLV